MNNNDIKLIEKLITNLNEGQYLDIIVSSIHGSFKDNSSFQYYFNGETYSFYENERSKSYRSGFDTPEEVRISSQIDSYNKIEHYSYKDEL